MSLAKNASLRQLLTLQTVARLGSVTLAAEALHLSQSAVSIQLAGLEASVGTALLVRTGHGVRLTDAGEVLLDYADRLLLLWHEASDEMASFHGDFSGTLKVGAVTTAEYFVPRLLVTFANESPKTKVKLRVGNREEIVRMLAAHEIDIAVMGQPPKELKVSAFAFAENPMAFVAAPDHPLVSQPKLTMAMVAEAHLLVREKGSGSRGTVERLFHEAGLRLRIGSELSSNESIKQMCAAGFGPAYLSMHTCVLELNAGLLVMLPMAGNPVTREWFCVRMASRDLAPVASAFGDFLRLRAQDEMQYLNAALPPRHSPGLATLAGAQTGGPPGRGAAQPTPLWRRPRP